VKNSSDPFCCHLTERAEYFYRDRSLGKIVQGAVHDITPEQYDSTLTRYATGMAGPERRLVIWFDAPEVFEKKDYGQRLEGPIETLDMQQRIDVRDAKGRRVHTVTQRINLTVSGQATITSSARKAWPRPAPSLWDWMWENCGKRCSEAWPPYAI